MNEGRGRVGRYRHMKREDLINHIRHLELKIQKINNSFKFNKEFFISKTHDDKRGSLRFTIPKQYVKRHFIKSCTYYHFKIREFKG